MEQGSKIRNQQIKKAVELLKEGKLVAIPTETVYGLAANAFDENAVKSIYETKNRPPINPLIVHIKGISELDSIAKNIPEEAIILANHFWPGPLTLILEKKDHISPIVTANKTTVGVRVPNHPLTLELLNILEFPLVAPSANRSNHISPTSPEHVKSSLGNKAPFVLDGGICSAGIESTIVGFKNNEIILYRHGAIPKEAIEEVLHCSLVEKNNAEIPESPGMFKKHYSPHTKLILTSNLEKDLAKYSSKNIGIITFQHLINGFPKNNQRILSVKGDLKEAAANLYATLHELDNLNLDIILAEKMPNSHHGVAINDRLERASN